MSCSKCYHELREESNLFIECAGCGDRYHHVCLNTEDLGSYFKSMRDQVFWYCRDCADDSDSTREELKSLWSKVSTTNYLQPPKNTKQEEVAQNPEVLDTLVKTVNERDDSSIDQNRTAKRAKMDFPEDTETEKELTEKKEEKNAEMGVAQTEDEKEAVKEDEPKVNHKEDSNELNNLLDLF